MYRTVANLAVLIISQTSYTISHFTRIRCTLGQRHLKNYNVLSRVARMYHMYAIINKIEFLFLFPQIRTTDSTKMVDILSLYELNCRVDSFRYREIVNRLEMFILRVKGQTNKSKATSNFDTLVLCARHHFVFMYRQF